MTELLTATQMRAVERAAIESGEVTGLELMERAGRGVVEAIFEGWPELEVAPAAGGVGGSAPQPSASPRDISGQKMRRAVVLCGPGNNGGDGFVVARLLHERGWEVEVFLYGDAEKLPPDARVNYERWCEIGEVGSIPLTAPLTGPTNHTICVDALFGIGLTRGLGADVTSVLGELDRVHLHEWRRVAIDIPSGLCSDSGGRLKRSDGKGGAAFRADLTVTFHSKKLGHYLSEGPLLCGELRVKSIGLEDRTISGDKVVFSIENTDLFNNELGKWVGHKYTHGHALALSGTSGHTGAARLAARGALRIGAGLVTLGVPAEAQQEVAAQITAIMMRQIGEARALEEVLKDDRMNALCLGPGLGLDRARELVPVALDAKRTTVLDADALTAYADDPAELFDMLHENCVLTPHAGEFARLFPDIAEKLNAPAVKGPAYSKVDATREAAMRAGCVVLFKGPDTVIAAPDGQCSVNSAAYEREAPWLATAGSGDVLAGFITGLLARGFTPMKAAETGTWLHVECALKFGPGLIAEDLPEVLPQVLKDLLA
jgi:hydroxyethylthiazole kinase-like uncharacterized protein yjeF